MVGLLAARQETYGNVKALLLGKLLVIAPEKMKFNTLFTQLFTQCI